MRRSSQLLSASVGRSARPADRPSRPSALVTQAEWADVSISQMRRAVTAINARTPPPEISLAERRKQAEREREISKRDRTDRKRSADDALLIAVRWKPSAAFKQHSPRGSIHGRGLRKGMRTTHGSRPCTPTSLSGCGIISTGRPCGRLTRR